MQITAFDARRLVAKAEQRNMLLHHCRTNGIQLPNDLIGTPKRFPLRLDHDHKLLYTMEIPSSMEENGLLAGAEQLNTILHYCRKTSVALPVHLLIPKPRIMLAKMPKNVLDKVAAELVQTAFSVYEENSFLSSAQRPHIRWQDANGDPIIITPDDTYGFKTNLLRSVADFLLERFRYSPAIARAAFNLFFDYFRLRVTSFDIRNVRHLAESRITLGKSPEITFVAGTLKKLRIDAQVIFAQDNSYDLNQLIALRNNIEQLPSTLPNLRDLVIEIYTIKDDGTATSTSIPTSGEETDDDFGRLYFDALHIFFLLAIPFKTLMSHGTSRNFTGGRFEDVVFPLTAPIALPIQQYNDDVTMQRLFDQWKISSLRGSFFNQPLVLR